MVENYIRILSSVKRIKYQLYMANNIQSVTGPSKYSKKQTILLDATKKNAENLETLLRNLIDAYMDFYGVLGFISDSKSEENTKLPRGKKLTDNENPDINGISLN